MAYQPGPDELEHAGPIVAGEKTSLAPVHVVAVHDQQMFLDELAAALGHAGYSVSAFNDPMAALAALDGSQKIDFLVTSVKFPPGRPNGIALVRMARVKRPAIHVIFAASPEFAEFAEGLGIFMPTPLNVQDVVKTVSDTVKIAKMCTV